MPSKRSSKASKPKRPHIATGQRTAQKAANDVSPPHDPMLSDMEDLVLVPTGSDDLDRNYQDTASLASYPKTPGKSRLIMTSSAASPDANQLLLSDSESLAEKGLGQSVQNGHDRHTARDPSPLLMLNPHARDVESTNTDASPFLPSQATQDLRLMISDDSPRPIKDLSEQERNEIVLGSQGEETGHFLYYSDPSTPAQDTVQSPLISPNIGAICEAAPRREGLGTITSPATPLAVQENQTSHGQGRDGNSTQRHSVEQTDKPASCQTPANSKRRRIQPSSPNKSQVHVNHHRQPSTVPPSYAREQLSLGDVADEGSASEWLPPVKAKTSTVLSQAKRVNQQGTSHGRATRANGGPRKQANKTKPNVANPKTKGKSKCKQIAKRPINLDEDSGAGSAGKKAVSNDAAVKPQAPPLPPRRGIREVGKLATLPSSQLVTSDMFADQLDETDLDALTHQLLLSQSAGRSSVMSEGFHVTDGSRKQAKFNAEPHDSYVSGSQGPLSLPQAQRDRLEDMLEIMTEPEVDMPGGSSFRCTMKARMRLNEDATQTSDQAQLGRMAGSPECSLRPVASKTTPTTIHTGERLTDQVPQVAKHVGHPKESLQHLMKERAEVMSSDAAIRNTESQRHESVRSPTKANTPKTRSQPFIMLSSDSESDSADDEASTYFAHTTHPTLTTLPLPAGTPTMHDKVPIKTSGQISGHERKLVGLEANRNSDRMARKPHLIAFGTNGPKNQGRSTPKVVKDSADQDLQARQPNPLIKKRKADIKADDTLRYKREKRLEVPDRIEVRCTPGEEYSDLAADRASSRGHCQANAEDAKATDAPISFDSFIPATSNPSGSLVDEERANISHGQEDVERKSFPASTQGLRLNDLMNPSEYSTREYTQAGREQEDSLQNSKSSFPPQTTRLPPRRRSIVNENGSPIADTLDNRIPQFQKPEGYQVEYPRYNDSQPHSVSKHQTGPPNHLTDTRRKMSPKLRGSFQGSSTGYGNNYRGISSRLSMDSGLRTLESGFSGTTLDGIRGGSGVFGHLRDQFVWANRDERPARLDRPGRNFSRLYERQDPRKPESSWGARASSSQQQRLQHTHNPSTAFGSRILEGLANDNTRGNEDSFLENTRPPQYKAGLRNEPGKKTGSGVSNAQTHGELVQTVHGIVEALLSHLRLKESAISDVANKYDMKGRQVLDKLERRHNIERQGVIRQYEDHRASYLSVCQAGSDEIGSLNGELGSIDVGEVLQESDGIISEHLAAATRLQGDLTTKNAASSG